MHASIDLYSQFKKGNEEVFARVIEAPNEELALSMGYRCAFFANYTAHDTVSTSLPITGNMKRVIKRLGPAQITLEY